MSKRPGVDTNIAAFNRRAGAYEGLHPEIFNGREQSRLRDTLRRAKSAIRSGGDRALDYGCGSGNLTRHLQALDLNVTATDVTPAFLRLVQQNLGVPTIQLIDGDTNCITDNTFDLIALYSVLHHVPDYIAAVSELVGKAKRGGVLVLEHERHPDYYYPSPELMAFRQENAWAQSNGFWAPDRVRWQHLLRAAVMPSRHLARYRRWRRISLEGDIHVHADDHIDWERVIDAMIKPGPKSSSASITCSSSTVTTSRCGRNGKTEPMTRRAYLCGACLRAGLRWTADELAAPPHGHFTERSAAPGSLRAGTASVADAPAHRAGPRRRASAPSGRRACARYPRPRSTLAPYAAHSRIAPRSANGMPSTMYRRDSRPGS